MKRQLLILFTLSAVLISIPMQSAQAVGARHGGGFHGRGIGGFHGRHFGGGLGFGIGGGFYDNSCDLAELYRELYNNLPYFALHPPVYYSVPVPRTYGYSPFAYPPDVMTPEIVSEAKPVTIDNPYVPSTKPVAAGPTSDQSAATRNHVEPLVIINPFVTQNQTVAQSDLQ
jgi:hypothetical protein